MSRTVSPEQRRTRRRPRKHLEERYLYHASPSGSFIDDATLERFLRLPGPAVLAALWSAGMILLVSCGILLYLLERSLASVLGGA
jgi:hypothetical protein